MALNPRANKSRHPGGFRSVVQTNLNSRWQVCQDDCLLAGTGRPTRNATDTEASDGFVQVSLIVESLSSSWLVGSRPAARGCKPLQHCNLHSFVPQDDHVQRTEGSRETRGNGFLKEKNGKLPLICVFRVQARTKRCCPAQRGKRPREGPLAGFAGLGSRARSAVGWQPLRCQCSRSLLVLRTSRADTRHAGCVLSAAAARVQGPVSDKRRFSEPEEQF